MTIPLATRILLEKAANDGGFDLLVSDGGGFLRYRSSRCPLEIWLGVAGEGLVCALSRADVARELEGHGTAAAAPLPPGAAAARLVPDGKELHRLLRRAEQLARSLPHELLRAYELAVAKAPDTTEAVRLQRIRIGQDLFRAGLLDYWEGRCAITGLAVPKLLRASHIKPWADCETDAERLDVFNGLLLAAHLDAAFDQGYLTVADDGAVLLAPDLRPEDRALLGLDRPLAVRHLADGHRRYLLHHRTQVFRDRHVKT